MVLAKNQNSGEVSQILIEVNWARERQYQAVGRRQGRKVVRHGMFLLNELGGRGVGDAPQYL